MGFGMFVVVVVVVVVAIVVVFTCDDDCCGRCSTAGTCSSGIGGGGGSNGIPDLLAMRLAFIVNPSSIDRRSICCRMLYARLRCVDMYQCKRRGTILYETDRSRRKK
jgi:hypothetical protein